MGLRRAVLAMVLLIPIVGVAATANAISPNTIIDRWASPNGTSGDACTSIDPCDIYTAVNSASSTATVTIKPGTYGSKASPLPAVALQQDNVTVRGQADRPRPKVYVGTTLVVTDASSLTNLTVINPSGGTALSLGDDAIVDHVTAVGITGGCTGTGTIANSVCEATGFDGYAVSSIDAASTGETDLNLVNVDAIATGDDGTGLFAEAMNSTTLHVVATNSILIGGWYSVQSLDETALSSSSTVTLDNSTYKKLNTDGGGGSTGALYTNSSDIHGAPKFVGEAGGFTEKPTSITVNKGASNIIFGSTDLAGLPRVLGKSVDIGAYELPQKAAVHKVKITHRDKTSVTLTAKINPEGLKTKARLLGTVGHKTFKTKKVTIGSANTAGTYTFHLKRLQRHTSYTFKVSAHNGAGTTKSKGTPAKTH